jgi:hypothetical protein
MTIAALMLPSVVLASTSTACSLVPVGDEIALAQAMVDALCASRPRSAQAARRRFSHPNLLVAVNSALIKVLAE